MCAEIVIICEEAGGKVTTEDYIFSAYGPQVPHGARTGTTDGSDRRIDICITWRDLSRCALDPSCIDAAKPAYADSLTSFQDVTHEIKQAEKTKFEHYADCPFTFFPFIIGTQGELGDWARTFIKIAAGHWATHANGGRTPPERMVQQAEEMITQRITRAAMIAYAEEIQSEILDGAGIPGRDAAAQRAKREARFAARNKPSFLPAVSALGPGWEDEEGGLLF